MDNNLDNKINSTRDGVTQIGNNLRADAHAAIDKVADKVPPATDRLANSAHNSVDRVADGVGKMADTMEHTSDSLIERGKRVTASCKALTESGRSRVRASPAMSVLLAAAAGYGLSKLLSSRSAK